MIIVDPVTLGDVACTRASTATYFDRSGALQTAPANTLRVTYDPADLSKAPYALLEGAATNLLLNSGDLSLQDRGANITYAGVTDGPVGQAGHRFVSSTNGNSFVRQSISLAASATYTFNYWLRLPSGAAAGTFYVQDIANGNVLYPITIAATSAWQRVAVTFTTGPIAGAVTFHIGAVDSPAGYTFDAALPMVEAGSVATSYIATSGATASRVADAVAAGAGVAYSNVPIAETPYSAGTTYAKDVLVYDPVTHNVFQSLVASNLGKALTDTTAWTPRGATNRWAMLDQYNNTQTTSADEILLVVSPQMISQGLYLGNMQADEVRVSVVDKAAGLVNQTTNSLVLSTSGSSFFNWCFKRIRRRDFFLTLKLPTYANALVTICIRKIGSTAKCGMCAIGPVDEFGPTLRGLSTEGKDYSSTTFAFDGTSSTIIRPYAKRVNCDVLVDNDQIEYLEARLFELRQKPIVWVGGSYGNTAVFGRYSSFKNIIKYRKKSEMNLAIEGAV